MKAIDILRDKSVGRPVDRVELALHPENMPLTVAAEFADWLAKQMPVHTKSDIDGQGRHFTTIAGEYLHSIRLALAAEHYHIAYQKVRMLVLLHVEAVGFGKAGRKAHKAHMRELLRMCRKQVQLEREKDSNARTATFYRALGSA